MSLRMLGAVLAVKVAAVLFFVAALVASGKSHIPDVIEEND